MREVAARQRERADQVDLVRVRCQRGQRQGRRDRGAKCGVMLERMRRTETGHEAGRYTSRASRGGRESRALTAGAVRRLDRTSGTRTVRRTQIVYDREMVDVDEVATAVDASKPTSASATNITPEHAMQRFEARRARTFSLGLAVLALAATALVVALGGDPFTMHLHAGLLCLTAAVAIVHTTLLRDPARYRPWHLDLLAFVAIGANASGYLYWGVFSGYGAVVPVSAYAFASGIGVRKMLPLLAVSLVLHAGLGSAQIFGWLAIHSWFVPIAGMNPWWQLGVLIVLQAIMILAIVGGWDAHRTMRRVIDEHDRALRELGAREAQLAEAHAAMEDARKPGEGRYTGHQLGRFQLGAVLGRGAMGEVYAGEDDRGVPCAVKVLAANLLDNDEAQRRFQREARAIAAIDSPHIVRMLEVSPPSAALPYLAMERLHGRDLSDLLKEQPVLGLADVIAIVRAVAAGLDVAHDAGVIHRDLKPANIFAATAGGTVTWKLLDFGVAKLGGDATLTANSIVGTPGYMAPEQARGVEIDRRADVYALGVVIYRMVTGRPAVLPGEPAAMVHEVVYRMPPRPSSLVELAEPIEAVLAVALAKSASDRFATAGELATALDDAAGGRPSPAIAARAAEILRVGAWGRWGHGRRPTVATAADR